MGQFHLAQSPAPNSGRHWYFPHLGHLLFPGL